jgi:hypothetical protein
VIWHRRPKDILEPVAGTVKENVPTLKPSQDVGAEPTTGHTTKWGQTVAEKGVIVAVVLLCFSSAGMIFHRIATRGGLLPAPIMQPFTHTIDQNNPKA